MQAKTVQTLSIAFLVALLGWGLYSTLVYIGVPIHGAVLITPEAEQTVKSACGDVATTNMDYLCRGAVALIPFVSHTIQRMGPFLWYAILSLVLYGGFAVWQFNTQDRKKLHVRWAPWKVLALAFFLLWLLFTTLSLGSDQGREVRMYPEPTAESYNVSAEGMQVLLTDYRSLLDRGCLSELGQTNGGTTLYKLRIHCVQLSFFTRVVTQLVFVLIFLFELLVLGRMLLGFLRFRTKHLSLEAVASAGVGAGAWIVLLWLMAVIGIYTNTVGWILAIGVPALGYKHARYWVDKFLHHTWIDERGWYSVWTLIQWLLISYIVLNFLNVVRPFPIGWDDLGSYLNRPRLLTSYGSFIHSMSPFEWSYLTSIGFLLFGFESTFGATASMMVNWSAGLLALLSVWLFGKLFVGKHNGALSALLYYSLPLVGHFSFADMKIDNAVFFFGALATLFVFLYLFPSRNEGKEEEGHPDPMPHWHMMLLAGMMGGLAFATKATAIMVLMALGAVLAGVLLHWVAFIGAISFAFLSFSRIAGFNINGVLSRVAGNVVDPATGATAFVVVCVGLGLLCFGYAYYRNRKGLLPFLRLAGAFIAGFAVIVLPWIIHNNIKEGATTPHLLMSAPNVLSPSIALYGKETVVDRGQDIRTLPPELKLDQSNPACVPTGSIEELDRYWGTTKGWGHYFKLPWRSVMNLDSVGYYVTTIPGLLLFPVLLLLPYFWIKRGKWLRWIFWSTLFILMQWVFLANGIPWYGIGVFLGLVVGMEAMAAKAPDIFSKSIAATLITLSLLSAFAMRLWQFEQQRTILDYAFGKISAEALEEQTIPHYNDITKVVLQRYSEYQTEKRPYVYRIGTFIPYFVPRNLEVIGINDHQLDVFNCLNQERNPEITLKRLKALGFNSIVFDTNTATIEQDQNGTLHKKVKSFEDFVNAPNSGVQVVLYDQSAGVAFIVIP